MRVRFSRLRAILRRAGSTLAEIRRGFVMLFEYRRVARTQYRFTVKDAVLFGLERAWRPRKADINREARPGLSQVLVRTSSVYWPTQLSADGLSWMYEEVNAPFWRNPSSYSHPKVIRGRLDWVVDGGSCEGYFSDYAIRSLAVRMIFCVEARADIANALRATFEPQIEGGNVEVLELALGAEPGSARLVTNNHLPWETRVADSSVDLPASITELKVLSSVCVATIDDLLRVRHVRGTGLIKLDVEGAEEAVLAGSVDTMRSLKPRLSIAVYHGQDNAERCKALILEANPAYRIRLRGMYGWAAPLRPYMLYAW